MPDPEEMARRLARLERMNRRLGGAVMLTALFVSLVFVMGQAPPQPTTLEAERFVVRGADGRVRAQLGLVDGEPGLRLYGPAEELRAGMALPDGEPGLFLYDTQGRQRAFLGVPQGHPDLVLYDEAQKPNASLSADKGLASLVLRDGQDGARVTLGTTGQVPGFVIQTPQGPVRREGEGRRFGLALTDSEGSVRALLDATGNGPGVALYDTRGTIRVLLDAAEDQPVFLLTDRNGRVRGSFAISTRGAALTFYDANGDAVQPRH